MKETELKNTSETSEREVQNLSGQDKARKHRKTAKAAISFIVMIVLLVALFFAAVNIGSLKVSFPELLKGLFVKYNEDCQHLRQEGCPLPQNRIHDILFCVGQQPHQSCFNHKNLTLLFLSSILFYCIPDAILQELDGIITSLVLKNA